MSDHLTDTIPETSRRARLDERPFCQEDRPASGPGVMQPRMDPLVTLAIPTLNRPDRLRETLAAALAQDYWNLEIIVSDNGSRDETPTLAQALIQNDPRARLRRNETTVPLHEHFTQCVWAARGEFFILLHDDDRINSNFVSEVVDVAKRHPDVNIVVPANVTIDEQGAIIREFAKPNGEVFDGPTFVCEWLHGTGPQLLADVTTFLGRTETIRHFGGYQCFGGGRNVDNLLFLQCAITSRIGFAHQALFCYRIYPHSYGNMATTQQIGDSGRQFLRHLRRDPNTVRALAILPSPHRKRILRGVGELTTLELLSEMKLDEHPFEWRTLRALFASRRDIMFILVVLHEYLRRTSPSVYYCLREIIRPWLVLRRGRTTENPPNRKP